MHVSKTEPTPCFQVQHRSLGRDPAAPTVDGAGSDAPLAKRFRQIRSFTERIAAPLSPEDCAIQSMPEVSPTRWHLAHTTWFFETFVLAQSAAYDYFSSDFRYLFNSYYNTVGDPFPRQLRGSLSRPGLAEVRDYRAYVDRHTLALLEAGVETQIAAVIELGLHHEQQHQELMLTDIKHVLSCNPLCPTYQSGQRRPVKSPEKAAEEATQAEQATQADEVTQRETSPRRKFDEGIHWIGHGGRGFAYDNESPRHRQFLETFELAGGLVTCEEYRAFIADGGYRRPELWLSLGWEQVLQHGWNAPLYWTRDHNDWQIFTLAGRLPLDGDEPVCHVSYFEADAFARWAGARLPTEAEWEVAAGEEDITGWFSDQRFETGRVLHPGAFSIDAGRASDQPRLQQLYGEVWQWTASSYAAYPGYQPPRGALGEYNGKFRCNQYVLRGASCATPSGHSRRTYRNFFSPEARWQFTGIRLAQ